jgi:hypothetical protein
MSHGLANENSALDSGTSSCRILAPLKKLKFKVFEAAPNNLFITGSVWLEPIAEPVQGS